MYPVRNRYRDSPYLQSIYGFTRSIEERIPTFARTLDRYLDSNFEAFIEEWQLLTDHELRNLESRLESVTREIDALYNKKPVIEGRALNLEKEIGELEGSR